jgi:transposase-like protein
VAMAALSGEKTLAELSAEFGVHPTMISNWKQELVKRAGELFAEWRLRRERGREPRRVGPLATSAAGAYNEHCEQNTTNTSPTNDRANAAFSSCRRDGPTITRLIGSFKPRSSKIGI